MSDAVGTWMSKLNDDPAWMEWKRKHFARTLYFDGLI